jgi:hypothetical protein
MRLLELHSPGVTVELHPRLAVVNAPESARRALVDALTAALRGDNGTAGFVEVHGIILDLDRETLRLLDLDGTVEMVLGAEDVPAEAVGLAGRQRRTADDAALKHGELVDARHRQVDAAADVVAAVEVAINSASEERDAAAARLTDTEQALEDAVASREAAERAVESASEAVAEVEGSAEEDDADDAFADELSVFNDRDDFSDDIPEPDSPELVSGLVEDAEYEAACHTDEASAKAALDAVRAAETRVLEARDEVERAARAANPARLDAAERAELDAAHDAVLDAEERAERRLTGAASRRKLDEAKSFERAVLDRLGLDSYSDFLLRSSMGSTDPSSELRLEIARTDLLRAESELGEARALAAATPAPAPRPAPVRQPEPQPQPVSKVRQPPQPTPAAVRRRERSEAAEARFVAASRARDDALAAESAARAANERAAADAVDSQGRFAELAARHDEADQRLAQARLRADADDQAPTTDAEGDPPGDPTPQVEGDGRGAALDELDRHLLAWLAARGQHPLADPLPIVLDDVYRHVSAGDLDALLVRLDHLADSLHVVYLTDDPQVVRWAAGLSPERGGLSMISDAGSATSE